MSVLSFRSTVLALALTLAGAMSVAAQSSDQNFPTPLTTSQIQGRIPARDIGDSRLTTHFFAFDGEQGDIFINVQTRNFDGDIDIFTASDLRPLTKIVLYSDAGVSETGRVVYLRKAEHLLLRVEGRTPGDDPATYSIKFAGSFIALAPRRTDEVAVPKVRTDEGEGIRLNSVGAVTSEPVREPESPNRTDRAKPAETKPATPAKNTSTATVKEPKAADRRETVSPPRTGRTKPPITSTADALPVADPLASVFLTVQLKNGRSIVRPMSEVQSFSTNKGVVTIIGKDGNTSRYLISDILKVTIQ